MSKDLSGKYYQENKERLQKKDRERYHDNMVVKVSKVSQKMKKINWLSLEKNIIK